MNRVGIIGFGKMGLLHGALINGSKKGQVVAICDKSWVMRFGIKKVYPRVKTFKDVEKMMNSVELDTIIIATPTFNHAISAKMGLEKNCNLFIEKPLSSSYESACEVLELAKEKGVKVQVGFCNHFVPTLKKAKELIDIGKIGQPQNAKAVAYIADVFEQHSGWRYSKETSGGGVLMDYGIHMLDLLIWYFGKVESVEATAKKLYSKEVEDELNALIVFKNGTQVDFETSWSKEEYRKAYSRVELIGTKGKLVVTDQTLDIYDLDGKLMENYVYPDLYGGTYMDVGGILYSNQMESFLNAIDNDESTNLEDAVYVQKVIRDIYISVDEKKKVVID